MVLKKIILKAFQHPYQIHCIQTVPIQSHYSIIDHVSYAGYYIPLALFSVDQLVSLNVF